MSYLENLLKQDEPLTKGEVRELCEWLNVLRMDCEMFGAAKEDCIRMSQIQIKIDTNS